MKRKMLILLSLLLLLSFPSFGEAKEEEQLTHGDLIYELMGTPTDGYWINITGYKGSGGYLSIPSTIPYEIENKETGEVVKGDAQVKIIAPESFMNKNITELELPSSLNDIQKAAFKGNQLEFLSIPQEIPAIGEQAFANNKLVNLNLYEGLRHIGKEAFANNQLNSLTIPSSVNFSEGNFIQSNTANREDFLIYGKPGSAVEDFAYDEGYSFEKTPSGFKMEKVNGTNMDFYYDSNGHRELGWFNYDGNKVYFDPVRGDQKYSYVSIEGKNYYFDYSGYMQIDHFLAGGQLERLAGADRYKTAEKISQSTFKTADTVVLALGTNFPDALAGAGLARWHSPVLLTSPRGLPASVEAEIKRLGAKNAYVLGGDKAIPKSQVTRLESLGLKVTRLDGIDRYETAAKIALESSKQGSTHVFMASGTSFPDALSIGPVAASNSEPILLTSKDSVKDVTIDALKEIHAKDITLVGGPDVISKKVEDQLKKEGFTVDRVAGDDRYKTSLAIANKYFTSANTKGFGEAIVAAGNGDNFADALASSYMGNLRGAPILLTNGGEISNETLNYLGAKKPGVFLIGGDEVLSKSVETAIKNVIK